MEKKELSLKEIQEVSLNICKNIDNICNKLGLRYYLYFGSLLGAVRHQGFIPWDDDIDIVMPRSDYNQLIDYFREHEKDLKPLKMFTKENTPEYPYVISRVSNDDYFLIVENEKPYGMGIFLDIYPWDGVGNTVQEVKRRKGRAACLSSLCYLSTRTHCIKENTTSKSKMILKPLAFICAKLIGKRRFMRILDRMACKYEYDNSNYVGCLVWGRDGTKGIVPRKWMEPAKRLSFDGISFCVPREYKKTLAKLYGNYMNLPPVEEQIPHHYYKAYKK